MDRPLPNPRKRFGQHFLTDRSVLGRIVNGLQPDPTRTVLEIGPGRGALTRHLLESYARVVAVEVDRDLAAHLRQEFPADRLTVIEHDVLQLDFAALATEMLPSQHRWLIAGNLPYNISKPIVMRLVDHADVVDRAVLMFQREVAARLVADPNSADYGPLSVLPRSVFEIRTLFHVAPGAFHPRPGVDSSVTAWERRSEVPSDAERMALRATLRAIFAGRRKTLRNNVRTALGDDTVLQAAGIDGGRRAQELTPQEIRSLSQHWPRSE